MLPVEKPRRPGLPALARRLQQQNPHWSPERCVIEAKARITSPDFKRHPRKAPNE